MIRLVLAGCVLTSGCFLLDDEVVIEDGGEACAQGVQDRFEQPVIYIADAPLTFEVAAGCMGTCDDRDAHATCTVEQLGQTLRLTSRASWTHRQPLSLAGVCTADCIIVSATCTTEPLAAGTYTIEYAGGTRPLALPSTPELPTCVSQEPR